MEETIKALQAGTSRLDFGDFNWNLFSSMRLPPKIMIPNFKRYDGTKDPRHHLRHYQSKMLQYWDYEEFIIQTFQDSLMGPALDWFMTLKATDIPTWADLSQKFLDQCRLFASSPFVIEVPAREPYQDSRVPWNYGGNVANTEQEMNAMATTRSGWVYEGPELADKGKAPATAFKDVPRVASIPAKKVTEDEAEAFMKIIKASEYKVVEQMGKSPAHTSLLALLLSSELHQEALLKVLTAAQISKVTTPERIEETVSSIFSNQISFVEDELPSEGHGHLRALHIVSKCNNHVDGQVIIDNGSTLNVCLVSTLKQMNVDMSHILGSKTTVRVFDGSRREVNGEIDLLIDAGKLITVNGKEDYAIYKETTVPYISIGEDQNLPFHSFDTIFVIRDYGEIGPSRADRMIGNVLLKNNYVPRIGLGACAQGIFRPIKVEEYRNRRGLGFRPSCHEIVHARRCKHLHRLVTHYEKLSKGIQVPPLSQFFPAPPQAIRGTSDSPSTKSYEFSSDTSEALLALPAIYVVPRETSSMVYICLA
ncbi:hypothetical protein CRG98_037168 [Punica granatum]|uniref:G-patch domain-containing protein n=1 Tax=Punica granatum TaxID=22663 RepID=A0A2I0IEK9_PUNGR|nr:hypothetical protein CRG98_037168 [Punica granatum]